MSCANAAYREEWYTRHRYICCTSILSSIFDIPRLSMCCHIVARRVIMILTSSLKLILWFQGKGTITTYFLVGYKGFDKPIPSLEKAASESEHNFK